MIISQLKSLLRSISIGFFAGRGLLLMRVISGEGEDLAKEQKIARGLMMLVFLTSNDFRAR